MFCKSCGAELPKDSKFCSFCGATVEEQPTENSPAETQQPTPETNTVVNELQTSATGKKFSGKAIAGFVLSLVGLFIAGLPCGILGIIFCSNGLKESSSGEYRGKGLSIAGLVISIIDIVLIMSIF